MDETSSGTDTGTGTDTDAASMCGEQETDGNGEPCTSTEGCQGCSMDSDGPGLLAALLLATLLRRRRTVGL